MKPSWFFLVVVVLSTLLTTVFFGNTLQHFATHLPSKEDGILIAWQIYTVATNITKGTDLYTLPIFYPNEFTLAYSQLFLSFGLLSVPFTLVSSEIIVLHNFWLISSTLLHFIAFAYLLKEITNSKGASLLGASFYTFYTWHLSHAVHLHSYQTAGLIAVFLFLLKFFKTNNIIFLRLSCFFFIFQALNDPHQAIFIFVILSVFLLFQHPFEKFFQKKVIQHFLVSSAIILIFYLPYGLISSQFNITRTIRDAAHFSYSIDTFLNAPFLIGLTILLILWWFSRYHHFKKSSFIAMIVGLVLLFGPVVKVSGETLKIFSLPIPLPYALFYYLFPPLHIIRDSSRFLLVFHFGFSLLLGVLLSRSWLPKMVQVVLIASILIFSWQTNPIQLYAIPHELPKKYSLLTTRSEQVLAEFPLYSWDMQAYANQEHLKLLWQTKHKKTLFGGMSGFIPPAFETNLFWLWRDFGSVGTLEFLKSQGVELLLVDYAQFNQLYQTNYQYGGEIVPHPNVLESQLENSLLLENTGCIEQSCLYVFTKEN